MSKKIIELSDEISSSFLSGFEDKELFSKTDVEAIILLAVAKTFERLSTGMK